MPLKDGALNKKCCPCLRAAKDSVQKKASQFFSPPMAAAPSIFPLSAPSCSTFAPLCKRETRADAPLTRVLCRQTSARARTLANAFFSLGGVSFFYTQPHHHAPASWHQLLSAHFGLRCVRLRTRAEGGHPTIRR